MATVLFVDDEPLVLAGLRRSLTGVLDGVRLRFADSAAAAVAALEAEPAEVVVSDVRMSPRDGISLLGEVRDRWPGTARLLLTGQVGDDAVRAVGVAHQVLAKPIEHEALADTLRRILEAQDHQGHRDAAAFVAGVSALPARSRLYARVTALVEEEAPLRRIADVVDDDVALTARILQLVNSAFFALPRTITDVASALSYLGSRTLQVLVLSAEMERSLSAEVPAGFPLDEVNDFSAAAASMARQLAFPGHQDAAFAAALLQDIGLLVVAAERPDEVMANIRATTSDRPLCHVEQELWGYSHADVGGMLIALWGLPELVALAVSLHHHPPLSLKLEGDSLDAVTAVQVALATVPGRPVPC